MLQRCIWALYQLAAAQHIDHRNQQVQVEFGSSYQQKDTSRQFLTGFSQGAILSMSLALILGNQIKGIAALSGYIPKPVKDNYTLKPVDELSIFIGHGKAGPIFPLNIGKENYQFIKERTEQVHFYTYPIEHRVSREEQSDVIEWLKEQSL